MDLTALLAGLLTALRHLDETTRERDAAQAALTNELAEVRAELELLKNPPKKAPPRKTAKRR